MIKITQIHLCYKDKELITQGSLSANRGEVIAIKGKSGCGKTSLLYELCLFNKSQFIYQWDQERIDSYNDAQRANVRRHKIGYVSQENSLNDTLTVKHNIQYFASLSGNKLSDEDIENLLVHLKVENLKDKMIKNLSGGERQRVAVICAIAKKPELLLLDEPTSQLDDQNEKRLMTWLKDIAREFNICIILTSHKSIDEYVDKVYLIENKTLKLIQGIDLQKEEIIKEERKMHLNIFNYLKLHTTANRLFYIKLFLIFCIPFILYYVLHSFLLNYTTNQINVCEMTSQKEVVSEDYMPVYVTVDDMLDVQLFFYYPENQIEQYLKQNYHQEGYYICQALIPFFKKDLRSDSLKLAYVDSEITFDIGGVMYDNIINATILSDEYYIFIPIEDYRSLIGSEPGFFVEDLNELVNYSSYQDGEGFSSERIVFTGDLINLANYREINDYHQHFIQVIFGIFIIVAMIVAISYCYYRKRRWLYCYIDGFSRHDLMKLSVIENICVLIMQLVIIVIFFENMIGHLIVFHLILIMIICIFVLNIDFQKSMRG